MTKIGAYEFNAGAGRVWALLTDPAAIAKCIPGCESLEPVGSNEYQAELNVGVGPIRLRQTANVSFCDQVPNQSFRLAIKGRSPIGQIGTSALVSLKEFGGKTTVTVETDSGAESGAGGQLIGGAARSMLDRFFECLRGTL